MTDHILVSRAALEFVLKHARNLEDRGPWEQGEGWFSPDMERALASLKTSLAETKASRSSD